MTLDEVLSEWPFRELVDEAMEEAWNMITSDSGHHPLDIKHNKDGTLFFEPDHWASFTADYISTAIKKRLAQSSEPTHD